MSEQIKRLLKQLTDQPHPVISGTVSSVDLAELTCDVLPDDGGAELVNVRLRPVLDGGNDGLLVVPAKDSSVAVLLLDEQTPLLIATSRVQLYSVRTETESLKEWAKDLLAAIRRQVFATNQGPTVRLINDADFLALDRRLDNLFND
jgi:hypothetical protein